jgi:hypothetical protein
MRKFKFLLIGSSILLLVAALIVFSQTWAPSSNKEHDLLFIRYEAEDGLPVDKAGEKRRDYAVLETTLNDLASPKNPEYKYFIQHRGPGKEIVIDDRTCVANEFTDTHLNLDQPNDNIDGADIRSIPVDIQDDFKRRSKEAARSLADFKPANANIIVHDLDHMREKAPGAFDDSLGAIRRKYPTAWGYVLAYLPGYSKDGMSAVVVFYLPNGAHGGDAVYMLQREAKRWIVVWRHFHFYR